MGERYICSLTTDPTSVAVCKHVYSGGGSGSVQLLACYCCCDASGLLRVWLAAAAARSRCFPPRQHCCAQCCAELAAKPCRQQRSALTPTLGAPVEEIRAQLEKAASEQLEKTASKQLEEGAVV